MVEEILNGLKYIILIPFFLKNIKLVNQLGQVPSP
jgi:hypothetical protein